MLLDKPLIREIFIRFMGRLVRVADRSVYLIVDNLRVHNGARSGRGSKTIVISSKSIPRHFALELNPDEYPNKDLTLGVRKRVPARTRADLLRAA